MAMDAARVHDAFVSYGHAADGALAPALRNSLERLAKPWYRRRALRVYLDTSGLEVTPELWSTIARALDGSEHLVLLASPAAADSEWVDRELRHWLAHHPASTILPVLTEGEWVWDADAGDLDRHAGTAVPPALIGAFREEPRYLDLRWARSRTDLDLRNVQFRDAVAQLAAPLRGIPKHDLVGEDIRLHRRALRTAWAAVAALVVLAVTTTAAAFIAVDRARTANEQRDIATSRFLAAQSDNRRDSDPQLATLLALAGRTVSDTPETTAAVLRSAEHDKRVRAFLPGHEDIVETTAFSPDATRLATSGPDGRIKLWDVPGRTQLAEMQAAVVSAVAFTPDGATLLSGDGTGITRWNVADGTRVGTVPGDVLSLAVSADGMRVVTGSRDGTVVVRALPDGAELARFTGMFGTVTAVALSTDGRTVAAADFGGNGQVWDVGTRQPLARFDTALNTKGRLAFNADGSVLAASGRDGAVHFVATSDWSVHSAQGDGRTVNGMIFVDDGTLQTVSIVGNAVVWDVATGAPQRVVAGPLTFVTGSAVAPGGRLIASGGFDGTTVLWDLDGAFAEQADVAGPVTAAVLDPSGTRLAVSQVLGAVEVRALGSSAAPVIVEAPDIVNALSWTPDGQQLAVAMSQGVVQVYDMPDLRPARRLDAVSPYGVVRVTHSPDGTLLAGVLVDGGVVVWDTRDGHEMARLPTATTDEDQLHDFFNHVAFSPDGRTLAHSSIGGLALWDVATRTDTPLPVGPSAVGTTSLAFSPDGRTLAQGGGDSKIVLWDVGRPDAEPTVLSGQRSAVTALAWSADGATVAAGTSTDAVTVWDVATRSVRVVLSETGPVAALAATPGGLFAGGRDGLVRYDLDPDAAYQRLCGLVGRDLTEAEWRSYVAGRDPVPLCPIS